MNRRTITKVLLGKGKRPMVILDNGDILHLLTDLKVIHEPSSSEYGEVSLKAIFAELEP